MTDYSSYHRVMRWEPGVFDATAPTSVHRLQQLFEQANHLLDSQLQTRISFSCQSAGWSPSSYAEEHTGYRLLQSFLVPWRVLTYGENAPALARPIVMAAGMMFDYNELVTSIELGITMQPADSTPKMSGSNIIMRWLSSPISATTPTIGIESTADIPPAKLVSFPPEVTTKVIKSREKNDAGSLYTSATNLVMVRFNAWMKANFSDGEEWLIPPGFLSNLYVREGAR